MQHTDPQTLIHDADQLLQVADAEINKAEEDAVTHLICHNSRQSIANYLMSYLLDHGKHLPYPTTLDSLLEKCQESNPVFNQINLSNIHCRFETDDQRYCLDHQTVDECYRIARQTQELVKN